jgi:AmmeMemoRadiSam system protein A
MALEPGDGAALARLAAATVGACLAGAPMRDGVPEPDAVAGSVRDLVSGPVAASAALTEPGSCFVTLEVNGRLRGCVGTIEPARPLYLDAMRNAQRAMRDPRMPAVQAAEWPYLDVKVSVLSAAGDLAAGSRAELVNALRPGVDGVLITDGTRRATFLPAVWAKLRDPETFVAALLAKGGWAPTGWPAGLVASRYTTSDYRDSPPRPALPSLSPAAPGGAGADPVADDRTP